MSTAPSARRFAAVAFFRLRVEIAKKKSSVPDRSPLAVVVAKKAGMDERSLLGNTRIDEVSSEAWALGVRPGFTIAAARAKSAELRVRVVPAGAVEETLISISEMSLAFGATAAFDSQADVVFLDITGCAHLHATPEDPCGERSLAEKWQRCVRSLGYESRVAIAGGPRMAAALARFDARGRASTAEPFVSTDDRAAMGALPIHALPLSAEAIHWLRKIGIKTASDLRALPRRALGTRLGKESARVLPLLEGEDGDPLNAYVPPEIPQERAELEYGIESTEALLFVAKMLCDRMALRLSGRWMSAARIELLLDLDKALVTSSGVTLSLPLSASLYRAQDLLSVLRARLDSFEISAPILTVSLRCPELVAREGKPLDLFVPEARAEGILPRLSAELSAELGEDRVGVLDIANTWSPSERTRLVPYARVKKRSLAPALSVLPSLLSRVPEPSRFVPQPLPFRGRLVRLLSRTEAVEWWKTPVSARTWVEAWASEEEACAWVEIDRQTGERRIRGWMD